MVFILLVQSHSNDLYLQECNHVRDGTSQDVHCAGNACSAVLAGPLSHNVPFVVADTQAGADSFGHKELGVDGEADKGPVDGKDSLTGGWVLVGGADGLHQELGLGF